MKLKLPLLSRTTQRSASYLFSPQGSLDRRATTPPPGGSRNRTPTETLAVLQIENSPTGSTITAGAREEGGVRGSGRAMLLLPVFHAGQTARANCCLLLLAVLLLLSRLPRAFRDACRAPASPLQHTQTHTHTNIHTSRCSFGLCGFSQLLPQFIQSPPTLFLTVAALDVFDAFYLEMTINLTVLLRFFFYSYIYLHTYTCIHAYT